MSIRKINQFSILAIVALILTLTACGNNSGLNNSSTAQSAAPVQETAQASPEVKDSSTSAPATRIVQTPGGEVEIPANPQRIVTDGYLPNLLILGMKPVGSTRWDLENKVIQDQTAGIENTGERSLEKILDLDPDLIVTWIDPGADPAIIEHYEKIAPTIAIPYNHFSSIYEGMRYFGEVFGKENEAEQWLTELDQDSAAAREQISKVIKPDDTFALMGVFVVDKGFYIYGDGGYRGGEAIYQHLKLTPPDKQKEEMIGKETYRQISYEVVDEYAGDYIFLDQGEMINDVLGSDESVWKTLDAVKNNRVFQLDPDLFWGNDPISLRLQIKELAKMITERAAE